MGSAEGKRVCRSLEQGFAVEHERLVGEIYFFPGVYEVFFVEFCVILYELLLKISKQNKHY